MPYDLNIPETPRPNPDRAAVVSRRHLAPLGERLRAEQRRIVFTNGCFDILHAGHVRLLTAARGFGDVLVLGLNSDRGVRRLKGPLRPVTPQEHRIDVVAALRCVDFVTVFDEPTPVRVIELLRPHVHVKGGDYSAADLPEAESVRRGGGEVIVVPTLAGFSTTELIRRIRAEETP